MVVSFNKMRQDWTGQDLTRKNRWVVLTMEVDINTVDRDTIEPDRVGMDRIR